MFETVSVDEAGTAVGIVELRQNLGQLVDAAYHHGVATTVFRNKRRVAVLIGADEYDRLRGLTAPGHALSAGSCAGARRTAGSTAPN